MEKEDLDFINSQLKTKDDFTEVRIKVSSKSVGNNEDVVKEIKNFSPADGWISLQSSPAKRIQNSDINVGDEHIIAGEFYNSNGVSLTVRFDGEKWIFITCHEIEGGNLVLKRNVRQLSKINDSTYLNYDVFYKFDADFGYRPFCSAFTGFTEGK